MIQPVNKIDFWKERIARAVKDGREHYSVYLTHESAWQEIERVHASILSKEVVSPHNKVLDAGCGYGRMSRYFPEHTYTGVDFSPDFIAAAKVRHPEHEFVQAQLEDLPFEDKTFDVSFVISIKQMIIDNCGERSWRAMEKELLRVSHKLVILEYTDPDKYWTLP